MRKILLCVIVFMAALSLLAGSITAIPDISSADGTFSDGQSLVISGSGFGATGPTIYKWDDFEDGSVGQDIGNGWSTWVGGESQGNYIIPHYSDDQSRDGGLFIRNHHIYNGALENNAWFAYRNHEAGFSMPEYYVSFYYRWHHEAGPDLAANDRNMKMHRVAYNIDDITGDVDCVGMTHSPSDGWDIAIKTWTGCDEPTCQDSTHTGAGYHIVDSEWIRIDHYGVYGSATGSCDGILEVYAQASEDGVWQQQATLFTDTGDYPATHCDGYGTPYYHLWNRGVDGHPWRDVLFGGFMGLEATMTREYYQDYDDVYIASSQARIEIGNSPDWSSCTRKEIQIPTQWSDGSITIDLNQGSFSEGDIVYVFAVDEEGVVSEGVGPYVIGQQTGSDGISISSVSGVIDHGNTVTVEGMGFGSHPDYSPSHPYLNRLWDDFEDGNKKVTSDYWGALDITNVLIDNDASKQRLNSLYCARQEAGGDAGLAHSADATQSELYMAAWRWFDPIGNPEDGSNWKIFRAFGGSPYPNWCMVLTDGGYMDGIYIWGIENSDTSNHYGTFGQGYLESWHLYEVYWDREANVVRIWLDGMLTSEQSAAGWDAWTRITAVFDAYHRGGSGYYVWTDDAYISHTQARIIISDSSDFSEASHREIQIPIAWSDGSITFTVNQGSFHDSDTAYLFVVDENGDVSPGRQITFAGTYIGSCHEADTNEDGQLSVLEISAYISRWILGQVSMSDLIDAIKMWKAQ